jgi:hypothetical protein
MPTKRFKPEQIMALLRRQPPIVSGGARCQLSADAKSQLIGETRCPS